MTNPLFDQFFSQVYDTRWSQIRQAMSEPVRYVLRKNSFASLNADYKLSPVDFLKDCFWYAEESSSGEKINLNESLHSTDAGSVIKTFYKMDPASILVAQSLKFASEAKVLDMCAAPGGKSLILAEKLTDGGMLVSNEFSKSRRERLMRVFHEYIPAEKRNHCFVKGLDGNQYGLRSPEEFDAVLADVPCSGERHLLENKPEFLKWTEKRSKHLAVRQFSLVSSAWLSLKKQGCLVYSTCSISPLENDEVIRKLQKRRSVHFVKDELAESLDFVEKTEFGYQILPDRSGFGPMYFCPMIKD